MKTYYRFKFYFNARHSVTFNNVSSATHPHTWEVAVLFITEEHETINFTEFESRLEKYFQNYEGKYLNELTCFKGMNPTMENIAKVMHMEIKKMLSIGGMRLQRIEISENPTRTYIIED